MQPETAVLGNKMGSRDLLSSLLELTPSLSILKRNTMTLINPFFFNFV